MQYQFLYCSNAGVYINQLRNADFTTAPSYYCTANPVEYFGAGYAISAQLKFSTKVQLQQDYIIKAYFKFNDVDDFTLYGEFYIDSITRNGDVYSIIAYDPIIKYNVAYSGLFDSTLKTSLISYCNTTSSLPMFDVESPTINDEMPLKITTNNSRITGREYLAAVAGCMGGFFRSSDIGYIQFAHYKTKNVNLTASDYKQANLSDNVVNAPRGVKIQTPKSGVINIGTEPYIDLTSDFLFSYIENGQDYAAVITTFFENNYPNYYSGNVMLYEDKGVNVGDIITVDSKNFYVMEKKVTAEGVELISKGTASATQSTNSTSINNIYSEAKTISNGYVTTNYLDDADEDKRILGSLTFDNNATLNDGVLTASDVVLPIQWSPSAGTTYDNMSLVTLAKYLLSLHGISTEEYSEETVYCLFGVSHTIDGFSSALYSIELDNPYWAYSISNNRYVIAVPSNETGYYRGDRVSTCEYCVVTIKDVNGKPVKKYCLVAYYITGNTHEISYSSTLNSLRYVLVQQFISKLDFWSATESQVYTYFSQKGQPSDAQNNYVTVRNVIDSQIGDFKTNKISIKFNTKGLYRVSYQYKGGNYGIIYILNQ